MDRFFGAERGSVLVMVLVFSAALLILGGALITYAVNDNFIARHQEHDTRLYYIAEAGIEAGVAALRKNYSFHRNIEQEIGGGSYHATIIIPPHADYPELPAGQRMVISTGRLEGKALTLKVIVSLNDLYSKALMVSSKLHLTNTTINGNLHYNELLKVLPGTTEIRGDLSYPQGKAPEIVPPAVLTVTGQTSIAPPIPIPTIDFDSFIKDVDITYTGSQTWTTAPPFKKILVKGDLTVRPGKDQTFDFNGVIIVQGDLTINPQKGANTFLNGSFVAGGGIKVQPDADINPAMNEKKVIFVSNRYINISTTGSTAPALFGGSVLLFSKGDINISGKTDDKLQIFGTIIAEGTFYLTDAVLTYDPDVFIDSDYIPGLQVVIREWLKL
jgi:hypothetical protein